MGYKCVRKLSEVECFLHGADIVAFDFETAPNDAFREDDKAALDAHKAHIVGVSLSVAQGEAIYVPIAHRNGKNVEDSVYVLVWLASVLFQNPNITKVVHNLTCCARS